MRLVLIGFATLGIALPVTAQGTPAPRRLTLQEAVEVALTSGPEAKAATASFERVKAEARGLDGRLRPQVALSSTLTRFDHGINQITLPDGSQQFIGQSNNYTDAALVLSQAVTPTGGTLTMRTGLSRADQFGNVSSQSWQSTPVLFGVSQPLFRLNAFKWDQRQSVATTELGQRQFYENRATIARRVADAYLELHSARIALENATTNAAVADTVLRLNEQRYQIAGVKALDLARSELKALQERMTLEEAVVTRDRAAASLNLVMGLSPSTEIETQTPVLLDSAAVSPEVAAAAVAQSGVAAARLVADSLAGERRIAQARADSRGSATIDANVGFNQTAGTLPSVYQSPLGRQNALIRLSLPLLQGGSGDAARAAASYELASSLATARLAVDEAKQNARFAAQSLAMFARQVRLAATADSIADLQFRIARRGYADGTLSYTEFLLSQQEKNNAVLGRVAATRRYWTTYYDLQRLLARPDPN